MDAERTAKFLREYADFSLTIPLKIAECIHVELIKAHAEKDFDSVAKLQVKLHAELVVSLESAGALFYSFSRWEQAGGIEMTLLTYNSREMLKFLNDIFNSDNILERLGFPKKENILNFCDKKNRDYIEKNYNKELTNRIKSIIGFYRDEIVRTLYNKVKHSGLVIRDISVIGEKQPEKNINIYIPFYNSKKKKIEKIYMPVVYSNAVELAEKYLKNIKFIVNTTQTLSKFFAFSLKRGLLSTSSKS